MLFCDNLLYLHVPKTGGMSVTELLLRVCPRPTYVTHPASEPRLGIEGVHEIDGIRHETLREAASLVPKIGRTISDFPIVLSTIRNPYAIEVSRFAYYQKGHPWDAHHKGSDHALAGDFRSFALTAEPHGGANRGIESYFLLDGVEPENLRIARYENLSNEVCHVLAQAGVAAQPSELPHNNTSVHRHWRTYYDAETEAAVFSRYRWVFDLGYYERLQV